uniref:ARAD1C35222p n=1 Tax=Blastobotrys adeninivorans TaxID=409370 RepID=A0A060T3N7_BLAAD
MADVSPFDEYEANTSAPPKPAKGMEAPITVEPIRKQDLQPSYAHQLETPRNGWYGSLISGLGNIIGTLGAIPVCCCCPNKFREVDQGHVGLVTRFGQFYRAVDPGLTVVNPLAEKMYQVEVRIQVLDIPHQTCMTKDNVNIRLSSVMYYHIVSPHKAHFGIHNVIQALHERTQTTLRHVIGARSLQEIIERREEVAQSIQEIIDDTASSWGVKVESILIKDILLSDELQDSLAQAAKSRRAGESKIITAKAEVESAKLMRKAADILASKPAMQIRYLEAMQSMARSSNAKVIFMPSQNSIENVANTYGDPTVQAAMDDDRERENDTRTQRIAENIAYQELQA